MVGERREQRFDGIQDDAPGADRVDRVAQANEQSFEVVFAGFLDLAAFDADEIELELLVGNEVVQIEAERPYVLGQFLVGLFEAHEHARLAVLHRSADQALHGQQGLAGAGAAAHQRRPASGQSTAGNLIQSGDAGRAFLQVTAGLAIMGSSFVHGCTGLSSRNHLRVSLPQRLLQGGQAAPASQVGENRHMFVQGHVGQLAGAMDFQSLPHGLGT